MTRHASATPPIDDIERDYLEALHRLQAGVPTNRELKALVKQGRLRINVSTVAKEAGRSRTLLAMEKSRYTRVRQLILLGKPGKQVLEPRTAGETIATLRATVASLRDERDKATALNLSYFERMRAAEREVERLKSALKRQRADLGGSSGQSGLLRAK